MDEMDDAPDLDWLRPETTIEELVARLPRAATLLRRFGIVCIQCGEPVWGTLREAAADRGVVDLETVLAALRSDAAAARPVAESRQSG